ncbi:hypothetical protein PFISCL1PPCAC_17179, partial [Pristionchus fissidentatus]
LPQTRCPPMAAAVTVYRSASLLQAVLLLTIVASLVPSACGLTFYVPPNMEVEKAVREMLSKMDETEKDNIRNYCDISSTKVPIPATQKSLIVMCEVLGFKPLIGQAKPKRSLVFDQVLRPSRYY